MANTLLFTKLQIPRSNRELVHRWRLIERLDAGLRGKLPLIYAPTGFSKTMLLSKWIR